MRGGGQVGGKVGFAGVDFEEVEVGEVDGEVERDVHAELRTVEHVELRAIEHYHRGPRRPLLPVLPFPVESDYPFTVTETLQTFVRVFCFSTNLIVI